MPRARPAVAASRWALLVVALLPLALPRSGSADDSPADPAAVTAKRRDEAIAKAFRALDEQLWRRFQSYEAQQMFTAAVAGWAYLLAAEVPAESSRLPPRAREIGRISNRLAQYAKKVRRFVRGEAPEDAPAPAEGGVPSAFLSGVAQYDWPLGLAACFFAEAHARGRDKKQAKATLQAVAEVLEAVQQENGGWGHDDGRRGGVSSLPLDIPDPTGRRGRPGYPSTLLAATNAVTPGLAAAHRALGRKDAKPLERARAYYAAAQLPSGGFPYDPSQKSAISLPARVGSPLADVEAPLAAGALLAHHAMGVPADDPVVARSVAFVDARLASLSEGHGSASFGLLMGALSAHARGADAWRRFRDLFFPRILARQRADGTFDCACRHESFGLTTCDTAPLPGGLDFPGWTDDTRVYVTAIHALILVLDRSAPKAFPPPAPPKSAPPTTPR